MVAIQRFLDILKAERYIARRTRELNEAVEHIPSLEFEEYVRITSKAAHASELAVTEIETKRRRRR